MLYVAAIYCLLMIAVSMPDIADGLKNKPCDHYTTKDEVKAVVKQEVAKQFSQMS